MEHQRSPHSLSDRELLRGLVELVGHSRRTEVDIVAHVAEVDARRLFAREACASMFTYCTERLHFSEAEAYLRIAVARASREHPVLLSMLADGRLNLSSIVRLAPHLTTANRDTVLARAVHRSKRDIEELVAELAPRPDAPTVVRKLPERVVPWNASPAIRASDGPSNELVLERVGSARVPEATGPALGAPTPRPAQAPATRRDSIEPTAPGRYKVQFTASDQLRDKLERLQALMRDSDAGADLAAVIEQAVTEKLEHLEARRFARLRRPVKAGAAARTARQGASRQPEAATRSLSRHIPAEIRRAVRQRDGDRCCFTDTAGRRCTRRHNLEYHHRHPYGYGGGHSVENLALMCPAHNRLMAEVDYGASPGAVRRPDPNDGREANAGQAP